MWQAVWILKQLTQQKIYQNVCFCSVLKLTDTIVPELIQYGIEVVSSKPIGKGHFGEVWKARMSEGNVVVKIITNKSDQSLAETMVEMETLK